jgi:hypothetical protein
VACGASWPTRAGHAPTSRPLGRPSDGCWNAISHDGAQQRLAALAFALGSRADTPPQRAAAVERAQQKVREALAELRELAHGLYPVALADAGLAAAVESLDDRRPELRAAGLPTERFAPAGEEAAYLAPASLADQWAPQPLAVTAARDGERLVIELRTPAPRPPTSCTSRTASARSVARST